MFQLLILWLTIGLVQWRLGRPTVTAKLGDRVASILFVPTAIDAANVAPLRLVGAWTLTSNDPRFGGLSALALQGAEFVALSDAGVVIRFGKPVLGTARARIAELPRGPGKRATKYNRDSESLLRDPLGRGWWVGFENRNEVWLYDPSFRHALRRLRFGKTRWPENKGLEGLVADNGGLLLWPEAGAAVARWHDGPVQSASVRPALGRISDAVRLPDGRVAVIHRHWSLLGFSNAITIMRPVQRGGFAPAHSWPLRGFRLANFEGIAAESLAEGTTRLWLVTDDNQQRPMRTLLMALDIPKDIGA